jgi:hypothetical protein
VVEKHEDMQKGGEKKRKKKKVECPKSIVYIVTRLVINQTFNAWRKKYNKPETKKKKKKRLSIPWPSSHSSGKKKKLEEADVSGKLYKVCFLVSQQRNKKPPRGWFIGYHACSPSHPHPLPRQGQLYDWQYLEQQSCCFQCEHGTTRSFVLEREQGLEAEGKTIRRP